nr:F-box protein At5g49610-like isoform X2 [Ipomoea batatas]
MLHCHCLAGKETSHHRFPPSPPVAARTPATSLFLGYSMRSSSAIRATAVGNEGLIYIKGHRDRALQAVPLVQDSGFDGEGGVGERGRQRDSRLHFLQDPKEFHPAVARRLSQFIQNLVVYQIHLSFDLTKDRSQLLDNSDDADCLLGTFNLMEGFNFGCQCLVVNIHTNTMPLDDDIPLLGIVTKVVAVSRDIVVVFTPMILNNITDEPSSARPAESYYGS